MNYNEKIKDLTDKFIQEIEALKAKNEVRKAYYFCLFYKFIIIDAEGRERKKRGTIRRRNPTDNR